MLRLTIPKKKYSFPSYNHSLILGCNLRFQIKKISFLYDLNRTKGLYANSSFLKHNSTLAFNNPIPKKSSWPDIIHVKKLACNHNVGLDAWGRSDTQPLVIDVKAKQRIHKAATTDNLAYSTNYATLSNAILHYAHNSSEEKSQTDNDIPVCRTLEQLADGVAKHCLKNFDIEEINIKITKEKGLRFGKSVGIEVTRSNECLRDECLTETSGIVSFNLHLNSLSIPSILGIHPWERQEKQQVLLTLNLGYSMQRFPPKNTHQNTRVTVDYLSVARGVYSQVEQSSFKTAEALASHIADYCLESFEIEDVNVKVGKSSALNYADTAGIEVFRKRRHHKQRNLSHFNLSDFINPLTKEKVKRKFGDSKYHVVFLGMGSNIGNRQENLANAIKRINQSEHSMVVNTSFLYESAPMYIENQPSFLNAACAVVTLQSPLDFLQFIKKIENKLGREKSKVRNGPRCIDLDILFFDQLILDSEMLCIPHPRIQEREFVLKPLNDIAETLIHPVTGKTCLEMLSQVSFQDVHKVFPMMEKVWRLSDRTYMMGILNVTPDSFSDGGRYRSVQDAEEGAVAMIQNGADIIDIGGMSSRPDSEEISEDEEMERVIPVIQAIRKRDPLIPISVDTFRAGVAYAAVSEGANLINDITGGLREADRMYHAMGKLGVPICLMHMRGDSKTMLRGPNIKYSEQGVIHDMKSELSPCVNRAMFHDVLRWNITVDPGLGFSKNVQQNVEITRQLSRLTDATGQLQGFPVLVGPSRKAFIGAINQKVIPSQRVMGTAVVCAAVINQGANIVRVHDIAEMKQVLEMADAIWRK